MSYCELCGRQTTEKKMVTVDGTVFNVCIACARHGKPYVPGGQQAMATKKNKKKGVPTTASVGGAAAKSQKKKQKNKIGFSDETVLTPDFAERIREARTKMGLTHEQLGMKMNEKAQLLRKFETGTLKPEEQFAKKLERFLGIKLYVSADDDNNKSDEQ
ncbi:MAG TPA: multiprotein bridging factor aMBF1 [Nitrososphaera sp.]|nr:multiprotein bridging factor aMBF1 [Nitrososphaera sp.]